MPIVKVFSTGINDEVGKNTSICWPPKNALVFFDFIISSQIVFRSVSFATICMNVIAL
jgi:hypothetical protein